MMPAESLLIVDDEPQHRMNLRALLEDLGYRVREADNGRSALAACAEEPPALVLLDVRMPEMDGFEACARMQADPALREIPIIFLSGLLEPQERVRALEAGAVDFITKPYHLAEVQARVRTHLELRSQRRDLRERNEELHQSLLAMEVLNRKLLEVNERLRESEGLKGRFLAMMRNEINNPLAAIMAAGRELQDPALPPARILDLSEVLQAEAFGLDFQIQNIFAAAELESGDAAPSIARVDAGSVLRDVVESFAPLARTGAVDLSLDLPADLVLGTDAEKLRLVAANLVSNGVKFNRPGGSVRVRATTKEEGLCLEVEDSGVGIAPEHHELIFERFRQLEEGISRSHLGQGLGLSVARALVEFLGGHLSLRSVPGHGATFSCWLPPSRPLDGTDPEALDGNVFFFGEPDDPA